MVEKNRRNRAPEMHFFSALQRVFQGLVCSVSAHSKHNNTDPNRSASKMDSLPRKLRPVATNNKPQVAPACRELASSLTVETIWNLRGVSQKESFEGGKAGFSQIKRCDQLTGGFH